MSTITVGRFTYDEEANTILGPQDYMNERFDTFMADLFAGRSAAFNYAPRGTDPVRDALVAVQTDYAGWVGMRQFTRQLGLA
jgi:hypothetical protein